MHAMMSLKVHMTFSSTFFSKAALQCVEFHPSAKVLLTAGFSKTLDLFQVQNLQIFLLTCPRGKIVVRKPNTALKYF